MHRFALVCLLFVALAGGTLHADEHILTATETAVQRFGLGTRGVLVLANQIRDEIEGDTTARITLTRNGVAPKLLVERSSVLIEEGWYRDVDGDGLNELCVLFRSFGQVRGGAFEVFEVGLNGTLQRSFPTADEAPLPFLEVLWPDDGPRDRSAKPFVFALRNALCEVSREYPMVTTTRRYRLKSGAFVVADESTDEPVERYQQLNLAAEYYHRGKTEQGLQLARSALESIQVAGGGDLLADAYLLVARGYRLSGSNDLASVFERRAALRDALVRDMGHGAPDEE